MRKLIGCTLGVTLTGVMALCAPASAEMYKWVDDEGNVQYTQTPPPDRQAETIKPPPSVDSESAGKTLTEKKQQLDMRRQQDSRAAEETQKVAAEAAKKKQACEAARQSLEKLQSTPRVYEKDAYGDRRRIAEEERQKRISEAQERIGKTCN